MNKLNLSEIKTYPNFTNYYNIECSKTQIYLHHTAGSSEAKNVINGWNNKTDKISTCVVISRDGNIWQAFPSKYYGNHLGLSSTHFKSLNLPYLNLNKTSIAIEICNWGQLTKKSDNKYYNYLNTQVKDNEVIELDTSYKGFKYYQSYTDEQIEKVRQLLIFWNERYNIKLDYDYNQLYLLSEKAYKGRNGIYTHNSVRTDKVDIYPHPKMNEMLKNLI